MCRDVAVGADCFKDLMKEIKMPKEEWGVKRVCPTTGKRFYDLNRSPIVSPYTGEVVELDTSKTKMIAADAEDMSSKESKAADLDAEDVVLDEEDVDVDLGDDLLEEDDEDETVPLEEIADMPSEDDG